MASNCQRERGYHNAELTTLSNQGFQNTWVNERTTPLGGEIKTGSVTQTNMGKSLVTAVTVKATHRSTIRHLIAVG